MAVLSQRKTQRGQFSDSVCNAIFTFLFLIPAFGLVLLFALQFSLAMKIIIPLAFLIVAIPLFYFFGIRFILGDSALLRLVGWIIMVLAFLLPPIFLIGFYDVYPTAAEAFIGIAGFLAVGVVLWGVSEVIGGLAATRIGRVIGWLFFAGIVFFPLFWMNYTQPGAKDINLLYGGILGILAFVLLVIGFRTLLRVIFKENVTTLSVFLDRLVRIILTAAVFFGGAIFPAIYLTIKEGQNLTLGILFLLCVPVIALFIHFNFLAEKHEV